MYWMGACSNDEGSPLASAASGAGGSAETGGSKNSSASGGKHTEPEEAGVLPDSALEWEAATPDSSLFHDLVADNCDPADPCCSAFEWPVADPLPNIMMNTGQFVTQDGRLYEYVGTETVTWPLPQCAPKNPTTYHCTDGRWWKDLETDCPTE